MLVQVCVGFPAAAAMSDHKCSGLKLHKSGTCLEVQWLRFCSPDAGGTGSIPGWGAQIPHATQLGQKKRKENYRSIVLEVRCPKIKFSRAVSLLEALGGGGTYLLPLSSF